LGLSSFGVRQPDLHRLAVQGQREVLFGEAGEVDVGVDRAGGDEQRPLAGDEARHPVHVVFDVEHDLEVSDRGVVLADVLDRGQQHGLAPVRCPGLERVRDVEQPGRAERRRTQ